MQAIPMVRRIGFRGVELDGEEAIRQLPRSRSGFEMLRDALSDNELELTAVYMGAMTAEREDQMQLQVRAMSQYFESLSKLGAKNVIVIGGPRTLENYIYFRMGVMNLGKESAKYGIGVAVANELDSRMENAHDFQALFTGEMPENIGVCLDVNQFHLATENMGNVAREQQGRIRLVRLSDMMGTLPVMPGQGEIELHPLVRTLRQAKFDGTVILDHLPQRDEKIEREVEQAYQYLQGIVC
jgi:sugar phosphate isomerase/epimerase